ncbi:Solute carrier organic anion transporter family member 4C1 [Hypsibius exemplaris]|uniref:Solute carrier organic anion transporter family member n=1 Tax=Hypsibius exemplaris TaxID=2072580 RepID=A0A1W0XCP6_HYPEX|nr:Solute carrier organic anion transporter family member 4C1 [Hypsibius exemplaris]
MPAGRPRSHRDDYPSSEEEENSRFPPPPAYATTDEDNMVIGKRNYADKNIGLLPLNGHPNEGSHVLVEEDPAEIEVAERCGLFCWKPEFMQKLRNMKVFLLVFIITGMSQGMYYSYWNMTLSSIEKRLQIPSRTTGMITAINDVSHMAVVLLVAHFCSKGHRPRWLAVGSLIVGIAILTFATPELFANKWDVGGLTSVSTNSSQPRIDKEICLTAADKKATEEKCDAESQAIRNDIMWPIILLATAQILLGIGTTAPIVLALPFIDDNVHVKNTPIYFAIGLCGRIIGPLIGVFLGAACLSTFVDLSKPNILQNDPRWMGAWWLGYLVIGTLVCVTSTLYLFFPRSLSPQTARQRIRVPTVEGNDKQIKYEAKDDLKSKLSSMPKDLKRLFVNKVFMCRLFNDCIDMLVVSGYFNFSSKYMEFHFRMSPAQAGRASGLSSILAMGAGAAVGGFLIRIFKIQPKGVALGILISSFLTAICYFFLMMVTCDSRVMQKTWTSEGMIQVNNPCTDDCNCFGKSFSPVCDERTGVNYYSPCHAGCTGSFVSNQNGTIGPGAKYYTNCRCLGNMTAPGWVAPPPVAPPTVFSGLIRVTKSFLIGSDDESAVGPDGPTVKRGYCAGGCDGFWTYVAISASFKFIGMLPFSGNQMLSFRLVDPDLKSLSKGIQTMAASLFAFIPGPIIMGALIDSTCKLWNTVSCGAKGACLVYDLDAFRQKMHLYVGVIKTVACLMDIYVYFKVRSMKFERPSMKEEEDEAEADDALGQLSKAGSIRDLTQ